jgi:hypothetical protein
MKERSYFFPLALIAVGVVWLLNSMGVIPGENLWALTRLWPFLLIGWGLSLILGSYWRYAGLTISLLLVIGAVLAVLFAPQLGWAGTAPFNWNFGSDIGGAVAGSGKMASETRELEDLEGISIGYPARVTVKQGSSNSVVITADDNLLPQLTTEVEDGVLRIMNSEPIRNNRVRPTKTVELVITVVDVHRLVLSGAGSFLVEDLKTDALEVVVSGAGDVTLRGLETDSLEVTLSGAGNVEADGSADSLVVRISGFGDFKGGDLHSRGANIRITGAGSAIVWVDDDLEAAISGAGSVGYYGDPSVSRNISGAGSVNGLGEK